MPVCVSPQLPLVQHAEHSLLIFRQQHEVHVCGTCHSFWELLCIQAGLSWWHECCDKGSP